MGDQFTVSHLIEGGFLASSLIVIIAPGPALFFILGAGIVRGSSHGLAAAFGVTLGIGPHIAAATLGLAAIVKEHPLVFDITRYIGGAYLVYLGVALLRSSASATRPASLGDVRSTVIAGALLMLANPYLTFFFLAFFPSFVDPSIDDGGSGLPVIGGVFLVIALAVFSILGLTASFLRRAFPTVGSLERSASLATPIAFVFIGVDTLSDGNLSDALIG